MLTLLGFVLGALSSFIATMIAERLKRPVLSFDIEGPVDFDYSSGPRRPAVRARFVRIRISNKPLPMGLRWLNREAALLCHGQIDFKDPSGAAIFGHGMAVRWSGSPEPIPMQIMLRGAPVGEIVDHFRYDQKINIPAGGSQIFDVAAQFDGERECYGWSNESYGFAPNWRNPQRKLDGEKIRVETTIYHLGGSAVFSCELLNVAGAIALQAAR